MRSAFFVCHSRRESASCSLFVIPEGNLRLLDCCTALEALASGLPYTNHPERSLPRLHAPPFRSVILSGVWRGLLRQTQPKDLLAAHSPQPPTPSSHQSTSQHSNATTNQLSYVCRSFMRQTQPKDPPCPRPGTHQPIFSLDASFEPVDMWIPPGASPRRHSPQGNLRLRLTCASRAAPQTTKAAIAGGLCP
jgi:hypothetical protein